MKEDEPGCQALDRAFGLEGTAGELPGGPALTPGILRRRGVEGREAMSSISRVLDEVASERIRQEKLKAEGRFLWSCADNEALRDKMLRAITEPEKFAVLGEEFGEVAREVVEEIIAADRGHALRAFECRCRLRKELLEVAACCVAWVESLDARGVK